jgi:hypothetical protein
MAVFSKKVGVVGGDDVDEVAQFLGAGGRAQQIAVVADGGSAGGAQALAQTGTDQLLLVVAEIDAAVFVNDVADKLIIFGEHNEFTGISARWRKNEPADAKSRKFFVFRPSF